MNKAEAIRNMRRSGMSVDDICRSLNATTGDDRRYVTAVLRKSGMQETEGEKQISKQKQADGFKHSEEWVRRYILEKSHGAFEYVNGYINMDSHLFVRCVQCGRVEERAMNSFRSGKKPTCFPCQKKETEERNLKKKEQKRVEKETQMLIRAGRGEQISLSFCECGNIKEPYYKQCTGCSRAAINKRHELKRRRKVSTAMVDKDITLEKLYQRDSGYCYICGRRCDWNDKEDRSGTIVCGNTYPSIDHVVPLASGGLHSWENVRLAHRICNSIKSDKTA